MPDGNVVLKRLQVGTEGNFSSAVAYAPSTNISVYQAGGAAVAATRRLAVEDSSEFEYANITWEAPEENRGTYAAFYTHILHMRKAKGKWGALLYPDDMVWWLRGGVSGSPTVVTLPNTPQNLVSGVSVVSGALTLTGLTQPNNQTDAAKGKILVLTLSNASATPTPVSFTVNGNDANGNLIAGGEVVNFSNGTTTPSRVGGGSGATSVTLYTKNYFSTISGITSSAAVSGDTLAVAGINGFLWTFTPDMATNSLVSMTAEFFDGATPWQVPGVILPKLAFAVEVGKSAKWNGDAEGKDIVPMAGGLTALTDQVLPAISSYQAKYYSDPIGAVPGTTIVNGRLVHAAFDIENALALGKAADGTPNPSFVARKRYKTKGDYTLIFNNGQLGSEDPVDFGAFNNTYQSRTVMIALPAVAYLPCGVLTGTLAALGWPAQLGDVNGKGGLYGLTIAHAGKFTTGAPANVDGRLAVKLNHDMEVDLTSMGASYVIQIVNRINPNQI